jgi:hypothetical protein
MTNRFSIKGRGADIFFGNQPQESPGEAIEAESGSDVVPQPGSDPAHPTEDISGLERGVLSDSKTARQTAIFPDKKPASFPAGVPGWSVSLDSTALRELRSLLKREHRIHNTFRYSQEELEAVRDIVYEMEVRWGRKLTRNDVMRAALDLIIEDFRARQQDSFLARLLGEED